MKRLFLIAALLTAAPVQAARNDFGQGVAAFACVMLDSGYSRNQVYALLDTLEAQIIRGGSTNWRDEKEMVEGFNYQARRNHRNCPLRISDWDYGNFVDLLIGIFGQLEILIDPYADFAKGTVGVRALQSIDIAVRHAESFAAMTDAIA